MAGDGCWLHTAAGQMPDRPSLGLEHLSGSLSHAPINSSGEDMPMTDPSMDGSSSRAFYSDMQRSRSPFGAEELCRLVNTNQTAGMFFPPFLLVYHLF